MHRSLPVVLAPLSALFLLTACAARGGDRPEAIHPPGARPIAAYSPVVRAGGFLFLSGMIGTRPGTRELAPGGVAAETRQALENIRSALRTAGADLDDVARCTVYLAEIADYDAMNPVYAEFFRGAPPARTTIGTSGLPLGARVEIECLALDR